MKACEVCGAEYEPAWNRPEQKYCSSKCREKAKHYYPRSVDVSKPTKNCEICENAFNPHKFNPHQKYCSKRCLLIAYNRKRGKQLTWERRLKCLELLGGKCILCGLDDVYVMTIDHIHNNPDEDPFRTKPRKEVRNSRGLYRWIISDPIEAKKYVQILCWNHNQLKFQHPEEYEKRLRGGVAR